MKRITVNLKIIRKVYNRLSRDLSYLLPAYCVLCGDTGEGERDLCRCCAAALPRNARPCMQCGVSLATGEAAICGKCLRKPPAFDRVLSPLRYAPPVDNLIKLLKFQRRLAAARLLGQLLADHVEAAGSDADLLVPVPLHPQRLRERGFNQARELARPLSQRLGIAVGEAVSWRQRNTASQSALPASARASNVRGAFRVKGPLPPRVAIVDDVMTTGHTVDALARALKRAGARQVEVWVAARASGTGTRP